MVSGICMNLLANKKDNTIDAVEIQKDNVTDTAEMFEFESVAETVVLT